MAGHKIQPGNIQPSVKCHQNEVVGTSLEVTDNIYKEYAASNSENNKGKFRKSEPDSCAVLNTSELFSAIGQIWGFASRLATPQKKNHPDHYLTGCQKEHLSHDLVGKESDRPISLDGSQYFRIDMRTVKNISPMVQPKLEFLKITQKITTCKPFEDFIGSLSWRLLQGGIDLHNGSWERKELQHSRISDEFGYMYEWMSETVPEKSRRPVKIMMNDSMKTGRYCISKNGEDSSRLTISQEIIPTADVLTTVSMNGSSSLTESKESSSFITQNLMEDTTTTASSKSDDFLRATQNRDKVGSVSETQISRICADYPMTGSNDVHEMYRYETNAESMKDRGQLQLDRTAEDGNRTEIYPKASLKPLQALAKKEHAFSGALAGIFVSVCLHPVDTVKTIIQSCHAEQKSIGYIGKSIVSERGIL